LLSGTQSDQKREEKKEKWKIVEGKEEKSADCCGYFRLNSCWINQMLDYER
jgi:hypothetical protein